MRGNRWLPAVERYTLNAKSLASGIEITGNPAAAGFTRK
jgi:hypothetical protein